MAERLADLRIKDVNQAKTVFNTLAQQEISIEKRNAVFEARMAKIKAEHVTLIEEIEKVADANRLALLTFIEANTGLFQEKRKIKTDFGSFGLQKVSDLVVDDQAVMVEGLRDRGYVECLVEQDPKPVKAAIKERLVNKEAIPGCHLRTGDTAVYSLAKALVDEARKTE